MPRRNRNVRDKHPKRVSGRDKGSKGRNKPETKLERYRHEVVVLSPLKELPRDDVMLS